MEWGCMQALIDFDGWRKWKDFSSNQPNSSSHANSSPQSNSNHAEDKPEKKSVSGKKKKTNRGSIGNSSGFTKPGTLREDSKEDAETT